MIKYVKFYAKKEDMKIIASIADSIFEKLVEVPGEKTGTLSKPEEIKDVKICLFTEESRIKEVVYTPYKHYELLNSTRSPILEYSIYGKQKDGMFFEQQFYSCSPDQDFQKKVAKFFAKIKKEFRYVRKYKVYVSPNIDLSAAKFDEDRIITEEDLNPSKK